MPEFNFQHKIDDESIKRAAEKQADIQRMFLKAFAGEPGERTIKYLDDYAHLNFPNFENVNATYFKAGQQQLVDHIRMIIHKAKERGK